MKLTEIRSKLGLKTKASKRSKLTWEFVTGLGDTLSFQANSMAYAIEWAVKTGRLHGKAEVTIRKMNAWEFTSLLSEVVSKNLTQNQVPSYLNQKWSF